MKTDMNLPVLKNHIIRLLSLTVMSLAAILPVFAEGPFAVYDNDDDISRKFISSRLLKSMDYPVINSGDMLFEATDLKTVDVIEASNSEKSRAVLKDMADLAKKMNLEVLWSDRNNLIKNESVLYGHFNEKKNCYSTLLLVYFLGGWKIKCIFLEGDLSVISDPLSYGNFMNGAPDIQIALPFDYGYELNELPMTLIPEWPVD